MAMLEIYLLRSLTLYCIGGFFFLSRGYLVENKRGRAYAFILSIFTLLLKKNTLFNYLLEMMKKYFFIVKSCAHKKIVIYK